MQKFKKKIILMLFLYVFSICSHAQRLEEITVTGVVPAGSSIDTTKLAYPIQTANAADLDNASILSVADFLRQNFSSVSVNDAQNNPMQPDIQYRGFTASPLLGLAQGLAVYQNGARINEPLGDTVNWDLLPQSAIESLTLGGGTNPLYGLNSLGGALVIDMKNGFSFEGANLEVSAGSFGRTVSNFEIGGNNGQFAFYANVEYFDEDGWRDYSNSDAINFYGSIGWRQEDTEINLNFQHGESELTGNGASPVELLDLRREAIFTGPDITENDMDMLSMDFSHEYNSKISFSGNIFYRENSTDAFNGDGSEFGICSFNGTESLIEGLEDDDLEEIGLDDDDVCDSQFGSNNLLESFLNSTAQALNSDDTFNIELFDEDELSGTGILSGDAINNLSNRTQESTGADFQFTVVDEFLGLANQLVVGGSYFNGESKFNSVLELANINPLTRLTASLGTGTFVDEAATLISTQTESFSIYFSNILDLTESISLTASARANKTEVDLRDKSGERPELNGNHTFSRVNPSLGLTWQVSQDHNFYASYSESSRAPTPIELACNEGVFDLAVQYAIAEGDDPEDVDFECRLPNAFLADPPLDDVVAKSFELGSRGQLKNLRYSLSAFHTTNHDDILFQTTGRSTGLFANVDKTLRKGFEGSISSEIQRFNWMLSYSNINASFEDSFNALSPNHDFADDDGEIQVRSGDKIPGIPEHQFKFLGNYEIRDGLHVGFDIARNSSQILRGDESNQMGEIDGYTVANLRLRYAISESLEIFATVQNLFDKEFETFGLLGEEPNELEVPIIEDLETPIFLGAAAPRAGFIGISYSF
ncbi:MAG: TonB-dependent receptor [Gammaproteobacteria bacterium]|nr:TonB-dependent receptor [Gammaproteobacteria bacterium]